MDVVFSNLGLIGQGLLTTLALTLISAALAIALGTLLAAMRVSPARPLRAIGTGYVEVVRNTPLTVVFFFAVFVLPQVDIGLSFFKYAVIALTVYHAAFFCEAVRAGINSVGIGQAEAARAIGMTFRQTLSQIVLPQAFRTVIPPLINVFIALTKNSSIAAAFGVTELVSIGSYRLASQYSSAVIPILLSVAICYLIITIPAGLIAGEVERRVAIAR